MGANKIRVSTENLNRTKTELQEKLANIKNGIEHITDSMKALNTVWEGEAYTAFAQEVSKDMQLLSEACEGMQGIICFEGNAVTEYEKCERQVADLIAQIRV